MPPRTTIYRLSEDVGQSQTSRAHWQHAKTSPPYRWTRCQHTAIAAGRVADRTRLPVRAVSGGVALAMAGAHGTRPGRGQRGAMADAGHAASCWARSPLIP